MAKSELGTKRICPTTGKKFYDLNKIPVISPYTGEVVPMRRSRRRAARDAAAARRGRRGGGVAPGAAEVETVSLEEADAEETTGKVAVPESEDDIEIDDTLDDDDDDDSDLHSRRGRGRRGRHRHHRRRHG